MKHRGEFDGRWDAAILALLSTKTLEDAAKHAGISRTTLWRYLHNPAFMNAYRRDKRILFDEALTVLQKATHGAAEMFVAKLQSDKDSDCISAGRAIFDNVFKYR